MNRMVRVAVLGAAALATVATSVEFASARDRYGWRHHHHHRFHDRAVAAGVLGLAAGVVVGSALSQPRVVYRERPIVVDEGPVVVEEEVIYEPEAELVGPVDEYEETYPAKRTVRETTRTSKAEVWEGDGRDPELDGDYFPAPPKKKTETRKHVAEGKIEPWTAKWLNYCKQRFATFNARTGTYKGYDGKDHFCKAG
jgi:hypothetical protein